MEHRQLDHTGPFAYLRNVKQLTLSYADPRREEEDWE